MEILIARSSEEIEAAFQRLSNSSNIGCDTETNGFSAKRGRLLSVQFSDGIFSVLIPVSEGVALGRFTELLESSQQTKIFHNAKFDLGFLRENGYSVINFYDTMIAEKILTHGADQSISLADTLYRYFAVNLDKTQRAVFSNKNWNGVWTNELVRYALRDVVYLPELKREQEIWLERLNLKDKLTAQLSKLTEFSLL